MDNAVVLRNVCKDYYDNSVRKRKKAANTALRNVSINIKKGETVGIIGHNGSGKTTLLKTIAGIIQPTSGKISVSGTLRPFIELGVGFQPELTGRENIYLFGSIIGLTKKEVSERLAFILDFSNLGKQIDSKLKTYSTGMAVRLAFSAAMMDSPDIYLVDEILSVGDESFQKKSFSKFIEVKSSGKTLIIVSHSLELLRNLCDRIIMLKNGKVAMDGSPSDVIKEYVKESYDLDLRTISQQLRISKAKIKILNSRIKEAAENKKKGFLSFIRRSGKEKLLDEKNAETHNLVEKISYAKNLLSNRVFNMPVEFSERHSKTLKYKIDAIDQLINIVRLEDSLLGRASYNNKGFLKELLNQKFNYLDNSKDKIITLLEIKEIISEQLLSEKDISMKTSLMNEILFVINSYFYSIKAMDDDSAISLLLSKNSNDEKVNKIKSWLLKNDLLSEYEIKIMLDNLGYEPIKDIMLKFIGHLNDIIQETRLVNDKGNEKTMVRIEHLTKLKDYAKEKLRCVFDNKSRNQRNKDAKIVSIEKIRLLNKNNQECSVFHTFDELIIEIVYNSVKEIKNPVFGIGIYDEDGFHISGPNTKFHNFNIKSINGRGYVRYRVPRLPLLDGKYYVSCAIHSRDSFKPFDIRNRTEMFDVRSQIKDMGKLFIESEWSHHRL